MKPLQSLLPLALLGTLSAAALASDHREAPIIQEDPSADLADVYAFLSPTDSSRLVLAMTVNPFSVPSEAITFNFSPNVRYRIALDSNGDSVADSYVTVTFQGTGGSQTMTAIMPDGTMVNGMVTAPTEEPVANPAVINMGPNGEMVFAGPRDDPFFFDVVGFNRFLAGTGSFNGTDGFAGFNVSAIVIELPLANLGMNGTQLQVWAETSRRAVTLRRANGGQLETHYGAWHQVDRVGVPAINTALITPALKDLYNISKPNRDRRDFGPTFSASLSSLGTDSTNIAILASVAVPDTLKIDVSQPTGFPNGRDLSDDVIDTILFFIFNQNVVSDGVQMNDVPFLASFPFLGEPTQAP